MREGKGSRAKNMGNVRLRMYARKLGSLTYSILGITGCS
jgi:hypothetical protein